MKEMSDVYERKDTGGIPRARQTAGLVTFILGLFVVFMGTIIATTSLMHRFGFSLHDTQEIGGVVAGLGLIVLFGSALLVSKNIRRKDIFVFSLGSVLITCSLTLFTLQFPQNWSVNVFSSIPLVALLFLAGISMIIYTVFWVIVRFKVRNSPGGSVELQITQNGKTKTITVDKSVLDEHSKAAVKEAATNGGIGLLGNDPDGKVRTQTNRETQKDYESDAEFIDDD